ncbi:MAG: prepilin peptidase, partial [Anaerolineae bacterium]|nr:prepilin peptidase [Anaerolineae bacterium]
MIVTLLWGALGLAVGSVLNPLADRLPRHDGLSLLPVCGACGKPLAPGQRMATLAVLLRRNHCPACGARLPARRWLFEVSLGLLYALLAWRYGLSASLGVASLHAAALALVAVTDLEERIVPDAVVLPAALLTIILSLALS